MAWRKWFLENSFVTILFLVLFQIDSPHTMCGVGQFIQHSWVPALCIQRAIVNLHKGRAREAAEGVMIGPANLGLSFTFFSTQIL